MVVAAAGARALEIIRQGLGEQPQWAGADVGDLAAAAGSVTIRHAPAASSAAASVGLVVILADLGR